ncbi:hypothetical protein U1Q18_017025 [Sarracenia purpurea var. burkii]
MTGSSSVYGNCEYQPYHGLQPELFFKMSHEIYNYGEGLIGKVAADHGHKWIYKEPKDQEINFLSAWQNSADSHPRTWDGQFQSGIKTIALIAVREGVVQLGAVHQVIEDLGYVLFLRKKFGYIESIPANLAPPPPTQFYGHFNHQPPMRITPSMSSLEALLSKLPSVVPPPPSPPVSSSYCEAQQLQPYLSSNELAVEPVGMRKVAKEEIDDDDEDDDNDGYYRQEKAVGESSSSMSFYPRYNLHFNNYHHDLNTSRPDNGF